MKYEVHVPVEQYGYISAEVDSDAPQDATEAYKAIHEAWKGGAGLGMKVFAKVVHEYCSTGGMVNGGDYDFSANEKMLLNELKKLIRN